MKIAHARTLACIGLFVFLLFSVCAHVSAQEAAPDTFTGTLDLALSVPATVTGAGRAAAPTFAASAQATLVNGGGGKGLIEAGLPDSKIGGIRHRPGSQRNRTGYGNARCRIRQRPTDGQTGYGQRDRAGTRCRDGETADCNAGLTRSQRIAACSCTSSARGTSGRNAHVG